MSTSEQIKRIPTVKIAITAIFIALVWIGTVVLVIAYPGGVGYLNVGDSMIYVAALIFGPYIGAVSGGIGAMLGDMYNGFPQFAPGTFIIKFMEGLIVGLIFKKLKANVGAKNNTSNKTIIITIVVGIFAATGFIIIGYYLVPEYFMLWIVISIVLISAVFLSILKIKVPSYYQIISMTAGAAEMIAGYLLYATFVLYQGNFLIYGVPYTPFDILQGFVCIIISLFVYQALQKTKFFEQIQTKLS